MDRNLTCIVFSCKLPRDETISRSVRNRRSSCCYSFVALGAEQFLQKLQDSSWIDHRLKDIEFIFTYGRNAAPQNSPFTARSSGPGPII